MRLDKYLFEKFEIPSRSYADNLVKTGAVIVNSKVALKPGAQIAQNDKVTIIDDAFSSQGAYKLKEAYEKFGLSVKSKTVADIGCSNGGFTDFLLRKGADKIFAIDVGECVLEQRLLNSGRVEFIKANARNIPICNELLDFVCADLSFISLKLVLPEIFRVVKYGGESVALVKPQFELGKYALNKKGIVKDQKLRSFALDQIKVYATECGFKIGGETQAPVRFENKNVEFLLYLKKI